MEKFVPSLKRKYHDRLINREKQWPPRQSSKLFRLQLVHRGKTESYTATLQRGKEDDSDKRTPLAYNELFKGEGRNERIRKVLAEGDAGIGKTTLTISLSEDWACGKQFQEFELVLLLQLRHKKVASAVSLPELLKLLHSSQSVCESVSSYLEEEEAEKVLVIADGWDELSESERREGSFLYQFLFERFPLMSVLVTSRPSVCAPLRSLPCVDRLVEINGFSKDDIREYIQSEFASNHEKAKRLLEQLEYNPLIESVCSIPLSCAIVCHLWHTLEEALPSTLTQLYTKITLHVVCRNLRKLEAYGPTFGICSFDDLPHDLQQSWWLLCEFAYKALENDQIVFTKQELQQYFPEGLASIEQFLCFGLLQSVETILDVACVVSFHFLHLTFMEYLAALHLSKHPLDGQLEFFEESHFSMVSRFFFGIFFDSSNCQPQNVDIKRVIKCVSGIDIYDSNELSLCHCAFEAQDDLVNNEVIPFLIHEPPIESSTHSMEFGHPRNSHDCAAILYVISKLEEFDGLVISFGHSGVREEQIKILRDVLASKQGKLQVKHLTLSDNKLTDETVSGLFVRALASFQSLQYLDLVGNCIGADCIESINSVLTISSERKLESLRLSDNPLGVFGLQALEKAVCCRLLTRLQDLYLENCLTSDADINAALLTTFVDSLLSNYNCYSLHQCNLSHNNLGVPGAIALAHVISRHQSGTGRTGFSCSCLYHMRLSQTNLSDKGLFAFVDSLEKVCGFEDINLSDNDIHASGVSCLADAISSGKICSTSQLDLSDNSLGLEGAIAVGTILGSEQCELKRIYLSRSELTIPTDSLPNIYPLNNETCDAVKGVGQQLCQMPQNNTIIYLTLDGNNFTGCNIDILAGFMHLCLCLETLNTRNSGITSDDLIRLFNKLSNLKSSSPSLCDKIQTWYLANNKISDSGASTLLDYLPSLFPSLGCGYNEGVDLNKNPISREMKKKVDEELQRQRKSNPNSVSETSANLLQGLFSALWSANDGKPKHRRKPVAHQSRSPHLSPKTQCSDQSEDVSGKKENTTVSPDLQKEVAMELPKKVNRSPLQMLDQVLDFENDGVSKHLGQIAESMYEWEGSVAEQLDLTPADIVAIRVKYPGELKLQTRAALEKWKQKLGSTATYSNLIGVFERAGYQGYVEVVRNICGATPTNQPLCVATQTSLQECTVATSDGDKLSTMDGENSCDVSHDPSELDQECDIMYHLSDEEVFYTPPTSPLPSHHV